MFEKIKSAKKNDFYPIEEAQIIKAEDKMGLKFPEELRAFYKEVGYGFISDGSDDCGINRLMAPLGCASIRLREDYYEADPDLEMYEIYEKNSIIFYEFNEGVYGAIGMEDGKIYFASNVIADSLTEFLEKMSINTEYWNKQ